MESLQAGKLSNPVVYIEASGVSLLHALSHPGKLGEAGSGSCEGITALYHKVHHKLNSASLSTTYRSLSNRTGVSISIN
jgi:hypothetical protein